MTPSVASLSSQHPEDGALLTSRRILPSTDGPLSVKEEVITANVKIDNTTGEVVSKCGTHLGSFLPDAKEPRYCLDLSCLSGHEKKVAPIAQVLPFLEVERLQGGDIGCTLYRISGGECGQATLDKKYESAAIKFSGLKEGTCKGEGYTIPDGTKTIKVPIIGDITLKMP